MKLLFVVFGKTEEKYLVEGCELYLQRLKNYTKLEYKILNAGSKKSNIPAKQLIHEKEDLLKILQPNDVLVLLDAKGESLTSEKFASFLQKRFIEGQGRLVFVVGGAFGFANEIYERANQKISLSPMTFTHQMIRLIFLEQLYRAFTILNNESYHHE